MECFYHLKVLGLLSGEALVRGVASISQPCLLLKTLNALLGLFCDQRAHDDVGSFGLHHRGLLTVAGRRQGRGTRGDAGLSLLHQALLVVLKPLRDWDPGVFPTQILSQDPATREVM